MKRPILHLTVASLLLTTVTFRASPQEMKSIEVPLTLNEEYEQFAGFFLQFEGAAGPTQFTFPKDKDVARARTPDGLLVRVERVKGPEPAYRVAVDSNDDGDVNGETVQTVTPNSSIIVRVTRKRGSGRQRPLPYSIKYSRETGADGRTQDSFPWQPHYRAEGRLRTGSCETLLAVLDLNGDGLFDRRDFARGTSILLDRNGDGQIWGSDEYLKGEQIIEYCGGRFLIEQLAADGSAVALAETALRVPKVGERTPALSLTTLEGKSIRLDELKGRAHLLDFWASWCQPCVQKFALVKRLDERFKGQLSVIAVNVDEKSREAAARQIIKDYGLKWPQVMSGLGEADPVWKTFGGMGGSSFAIPLYVLIDPEGKIVYAGSGGEDLSALIAAVKSLLAGDGRVGAQP